MLYNLPTGKTIELTFEQWLNMTPEDEEYLIAFGHGEETNSIWKGSTLEHPENTVDDVPELQDIPEIEKLDDEFFDE